MSINKATLAEWKRLAEKMPFPQEWFHRLDVLELIAEVERLEAKLARQQEHHMRSYRENEELFDETYSELLEENERLKTQMIAADELASAIDSGDAIESDNSEEGYESYYLSDRVKADLLSYRALRGAK